MTIDELRAAALAAAIDENETTGWYLRWDAGVAAFRWDAAFTTGEERPDWADGSWPTVREALDAPELVANADVFCSRLYKGNKMFFLEDWDGIADHVTVSSFGGQDMGFLVSEIENVRAEDLSQYFEVEDAEEGEE